MVEWLRGLAESGKAEARSLRPGARETRFRLHCARLGETLPGSATRLVFCGSGEVRPSNALELLATLIGVRLWVPEGNAKKTSQIAIRGYTHNQSNEALLRKAMTTKFPSTLVLMELSAKNCELQLQWIRRDLNQLPTRNFASFDPNFRVDLKGEALEWRVLGRLLAHATSYFEELGSAKRTKKAPATRFAKRPRKLGPW